jgi:hypothetical protein
MTPSPARTPSPSLQLNPSGTCGTVLAHAEALGGNSTLSPQVNNTARNGISIHTLLQSRLSPRVLRSIRYYWWLVLIYLRRVITSCVVTRVPQVRAFGTEAAVSHLARQLRSVNVVAPTKMCRVMTRQGSDKGHSRHNYTTVYTALFAEFRGRPVRIFELGLGTNDPDLPSSMGRQALPGASLRGWREFFPRALIYGADIDHRVLFEEDRIKTFYCDQCDRDAIRKLWLLPELSGGMDIIIEDGLHTFEANTSFLEESLDHIRPGGVYVAEDIAWEAADRWCDRLEKIYSKRYPTYQFAIVVIPNAVNLERDNNLLVIRRRT